MTNDNDVVLTVSQVAARWKCARKTVYDAIRAGHLAAFRVGERAYRVRIDEVERFEREPHKAA